MIEDDLAGIRDDLVAIVERLDDAAMQALRDAIAAGEQSRPELERRLTRARHGIERVIALLGRP